MARKVRYCNVLEVALGNYQDEGIGISDFTRYYKVKKGSVIRKKTNRKGIYLPMYRLTPRTNTAYVVVIERHRVSPKVSDFILLRNFIFNLFGKKKKRPSNIRVWKINIAKTKSKKPIKMMIPYEREIL